MAAAATEAIGWFEAAAGAGADVASGLGATAGADEATWFGATAGADAASGVGATAGAMAIPEVAGADGAGAVGAPGATEDAVVTADVGAAATGEADRSEGDASAVGAPAGGAAGATFAPPCVPRISKMREGTTTLGPEAATLGPEAGGALSGARGAGASLFDRTTTAPVVETETGSAAVLGDGAVLGATAVPSHDGLNPSANRSASSSHEGFIRSANRSASSGESPVFSGARFSVNCPPARAYEYHADAHSAKTGPVGRVKCRGDVRLRSVLCDQTIIEVIGHLSHGEHQILEFLEIEGR